MANFFDRVFWSMFSSSLGIDLGTANTLVYAQDEGIVLAEPSVVATYKDTKQVLLDGEAVGDNAKAMTGKTHDKITVNRPLRDGRVHDVEVAEAMLAYFIRKAHNRRWGVKPQVVVSVPMAIENVHKRAVYNAAERAGANRVFLVTQPLAAAVGAGLPVDEPTGSMIVDIGGGTTDIAVVSFGEFPAYKTLNFAGDKMDELIIRYIAEEHGLDIGQLTAEEIKMQIGSATPMEQELSMTVRGRSVTTRRPDQVLITSDEIRAVLVPAVEAICKGIDQVLEETPAGVSGDLVTTGITLAGGGALLPGIDEAIQQRIGLPTQVCEDPITAVVRGTGIIIENFEICRPMVEDASIAA